MENLIIKSEAGKDVTTSLMIAKTFGKEHAKVCRDIELLNCSDEFNIANFGVIYFQDSMNRKQKAYEMTKDGFSFLVMGYNGEKAGEFKERFIFEFNKREALLKDDDYIVEKALSILGQRVRIVEEENNKLTYENQKMKTRSEFVDIVFNTEGLVAIGEVAKILKLNYGRNTLFKILKEKNILFKNKNIPYQQYVSKGYFELKESFQERKNHPPLLIIQTFATQKGLGFIAKELGVINTPTKRVKCLNL